MHQSELRMSEIEVVRPVTQDHLDGVMNLFAQAWWTRDRSRDRVATMLATTPATAGLLAGQGNMIAFARAISDLQFKAVIVDVIVDESVRESGLGRQVMVALLEHPVLQGVDDFELYCSPGLVPYYQRLGFRQPADVLFMRRSRVEPADLGQRSGPFS